MPTSDDSRPGQGDVVVVPFPCADRLAEKRRPALVVSSRGLAEAGFLWVVMITSARSGADRYDLPIDDLATAGLSAPCVVRPTRIACIEPARIMRRAGTLPPAAMRRILRQVRLFLPAASPASPRAS